MKKLMLSIVFLGTVVTVFFAKAQSSREISIKAGVTFPSMSASPKEGDFSYSTSFFLGGNFDFYIGNILSLQTGLVFTGKGYNYIENGSTYSYNAKVSLIYVEVPINVLAHVKVGSGKVFFGTGSYYSVAIKGNENYTETGSFNGIVRNVSGNGEFEFGKGQDAVFKRGDYGLNFLTGYQLSNGLSINAGYSFSLRNLANENNSEPGSKAKNKVFSVGLGFRF